MFEFLTDDLISKFMKFALVGASGMVVDFGITFLLKEKFKIQKYVSNAFGFSTAVISNYLLNRMWTFGSGSQHFMHEFSIFLSAAVIGLGINSLILWLLITKARQKFYHAKLFAIAVVMVWNFSMNYLFTFKGS